MATITLYESKINNMPGFIKDVKSSVGGLKTELNSLKSKCSKVNKDICNLEDVISSISSSTKTQEEKETSLETFSKNVEEFAAEVDRIDSNVAEIINESKDDFYDKYHYLKPDSEKSGWEEFWDDCTTWCKENWQYICACVIAVIAVVAIVALCVVTFGAAAVLLATVVGAAVGLASQLISDVIAWRRTGEWSGSWQSYLGAALGGIAGGCMLLLTGGNPILSSVVESSISTLFSESFEAITGGEKRPMSEILLDTAISAGMSAVFSKLFGKFSEKFAKQLSKSIPLLSRLSGRGSYSASFKMVLTKLKNGTIKNFTYKSIRNGIIDGLAGGTISNLLSGLGFNDFIKDGIKGILGKGEDTPNTKPITVPKIEPIPEINLLPFKFQFRYSN